MNCSTQVSSGVSVINGAENAVTFFTNTSIATTSPANANSASVQCNTQSGDCWLDHLYFNTVNQF